ncbi:MAG: hypothetical protein ACXVII_40410, partial [Solirubrobacteraceae bacterium]
IDLLFANLEARRVVSTQAAAADLPELRFGMNSGATPESMCGHDAARRSRDTWRPASAPALSLL